MILAVFALYDLIKYRFLDPHLVRTLKPPPGSGSTKRGLITPQPSCRRIYSR